MFYLNVLIQVKKEGDIEAVKDALILMRPLCLKEDGAVRWEAYHSKDDRKLFVLVEHWQTQEKWEKHLKEKAIVDIYMPDILPRVDRQVHKCELL